MNFVLDTNIVLDYLKAGKITDFLIREYNLLSPTHSLIISSVCIGELHSLALQRNWSEKRIRVFVESLERFLVIPVNSYDLFMAYAQIDAFSQGKLREKPLPNGLTARNMGKNDLWIAATAHILNATLLTTDKDFHHLDSNFINLQYLDAQKLYA
jgi:tRNA(fMet)-specific endonuclease VapC